MNVRMCPQCGCDSKVYESREQDVYIQRRRQCQACGHKWKSCEITMEEYEALKRDTSSKAIEYNRRLHLVAQAIQGQL